MSLRGLCDLPGNLLFGPAHAAPHLRGRGARVLLLLSAHVDRLLQAPRDDHPRADCYYPGRIGARARVRACRALSSNQPLTLSTRN